MNGFPTSNTQATGPIIGSAVWLSRAYHDIKHRLVSQSRDGGKSGEVDQEAAQALLRILVTGFALCVFLGFAYSPFSKTLPGLANAILLLSLYLVFSTWWHWQIRRYPGVYVSRRIVSILVDLTTTSLAMYLTGPLGAAFYPLLLWIIVGNGVRFGASYLLLASVGSTLAFLFVIFYGDFWLGLMPVWVGLLLGLVIIPLFFLSVHWRFERELRRIAHTANHDALTGLLNQRSFYARLDEEIARLQRYGEEFTILFVDLDGFKEVNDTMGHQCGDALLVEVGRRLRGLVRASDVVARLGGDEFVVLMLMTGPPHDARPFFGRLPYLLAEPYETDCGTVKISTSIGVSGCPRHGTTARELIRKADLAMYAAKHQGKNALMHYTGELESLAHRRPIRP